MNVILLTDDNNETVVLGLKGEAGDFQVSSAILRHLEELHEGGEQLLYAAKSRAHEIVYRTEHDEEIEYSAVVRTVI